ncbi:hypothetical protein SAMN04487895_10694 [Paenibacillus sophorae]|uniref:Uncharacterized protein n=1 Tax=Paenibacillus sophorae TaxID=1333845 RepID=A0A1H8N7G4_9BACL|nr:hypothetical protein [Paenibacillus sophorae]QWU14750.1 hypothetical protein KP014_22920 [Paenibacillus sophorae]SEO25510.1 hypothetical protein SAMN04487895_10694 [Paenibacillus sophorae]
MVEFGLYMLLSVIETFALFFLAFKVFKIDLFIKEMIFAASIMSFFSFIIRKDYQLPQVDIVLQYTLIFFFFWFLFRIHVFYAAIMTGMAYQGYSFFQTVYYFLFERLGIMSIHLTFLSEFPTYLLQISTASTAILVGVIIENRRKGFDFIPDKPAGKIKVSLREKILFALNLPSFIIVVFTLFLTQQLMSFYLLLPFCYASILYGYLYLSYKRDRG